jgi:hypothetical protein
VGIRWVGEWVKKVHRGVRRGRRERVTTGSEGMEITTQRDFRQSGERGVCGGGFLEALSWQP